MSIFTRDDVFISADRRTRINYDPGTGTFGVYVDGTLALSSTSSAIAFALAAALIDLDLGSSGVAGSLDIFPATAAKGKLRFTATDNTGDTITAITAAAMAAARTLTIPDPGVAAASFELNVSPSVARTATADGTGTGTIADGTQFVTAANGGSANNIVVLPTPTPGTKVSIVTTGALEVRTSAPATVGINGGTGASAESALGSGDLAHFFCATATDWRGFQQTSAGVLTLVEVAA